MGGPDRLPGVQPAGWAVGANPVSAQGMGGRPPIQYVRLGTQANHSTTISAGFTTRNGGASRPPYDTFNLGRTDQDNPDSLKSNYATLADLVNCPRIAICSQVHGTDVVQVGPDYPLLTADGWVPPRPLPQADAMVTTWGGTALVIRVADCLPVLLADHKAQVVAAAHAGRVGLLAGVLQRTVEAMRDLGAATIEAWIGPHICAGCYEVPEAMAEAAWQTIPATQARTRQGSEAIDLGAGAEAVLRALQVSVRRLDPCTSCDPDFFSHRRDRGQTGRQAGVIWVGGGEPAASLV